MGVKGELGPLAEHSVFFLAAWGKKEILLTPLISAQLWMGTETKILVVLAFSHVVCLHITKVPFVL